jgi:small subunit ribosomal protein S1
MKQLLEKNNLFKPPKIGEIIEGKIIGKKASAVFVELGIRGTGIIYGREYYLAKENLKDLKKGDSILVKVIDLENEEGYIEVSASQAQKELVWEILKQKKEREEILKVKILGANKGGLITEVLGISAFLPISQLTVENYPQVEEKESSKIVRELQKLINKELEVKILDIDQKEEKIILSEKAGKSEKTKEVLKKYKVGEIVKGEISKICDFGAFLKILPKKKEEEILEGLIPLSQLDWKLIDHPSEVVKIGQKARAKIIEISGDKLFLSLKALKKDPWQKIEEKYKKGEIIKGKVIKLNPYGAFVKVTSKIQGLCHISEFGSQSKMESALKIGEKYDFQILLLDSKEHRMILKFVTRNS